MASAGEVLTRTNARDRMLIAVERDLGRLLFGALEMAGVNEFAEHSRAARRVVSREIR